MLARHSCRGGRGRRSLSRRGLSGPTTRLTTLRARSRIRTILTSTGSGWRVTWRWAEIGGWQHEDLLEQLARDAGPAIGLGRDVPAHGNDVGVRLARSEERRVGKEWVSTCRSRWSRYNYKKNKKKDE